jgi:hypothetical protein
MWQKILDALLTELSTNPDKVLSLLQSIVDLCKAHPEFAQVVVQHFAPPLQAPGQQPEA